jgi:hypothetical protein
LHEKVDVIMHQLYRTTGWGCAGGSAAGALIGGILDFLAGTSGLLALAVAGIGSLVGSFAGFRIGSKSVQNMTPEASNASEVAKIHKQHGAMWSLMGAMVGGAAGSTLGAALAAVCCLLCTYHVPIMLNCMPSGMMDSMTPTMMNSMIIVNVVMAGGMGGMTGGVIGAWLSAVRAGFVGTRRGE